MQDKKITILQINCCQGSQEQMQQIKELQKENIKKKKSKTEIPAQLQNEEPMVQEIETEIGEVNKSKDKR